MKINKFKNIKIYTKYSGSISQSNTDETKGVNDVNKLSQWEENEKNKQHECPKWIAERFPLKFYIDLDCQHEKFLSKFVKAIEQSFLPWTKSGNNIIDFKRIYNKNNADILISWASSNVHGRIYESGHNNLKVIKGTIEKAEITIVIYPEIDKMATDPTRIERVRRTALHEIGHSLGLNHSNHPDDIMFHRGITNKELSSNDIRRLKELYNKKL